MLVVFFVCVVSSSLSFAIICVMASSHLDFYVAVAAAATAAVVITTTRRVGGDGMPVRFLREDMRA